MKMIIYENLISNRQIFRIILFTASSMLANFILLSYQSVSFSFLFANFCIVCLTLYLIKFFVNGIMHNDSSKFSKSLFLTSFIFRVITIVFFYNYFYYITNTHFDPTAVDSKWYHEMAISLAKKIRSGNYNIIESLPYGMKLDDTGYYTFLGFIYSIFGANILVSRIIEAIISSLSGVIVYKIGLLVFNHNIGKLSSIIFIFFPSLVYYNSLHLKETLMIFLMLIAIWGIINFQQQKRFFYLFISLLFIFITFYFRAILSILLLSTLLLTLLFTSNLKNIEKILYTVVAFIAFYFISIRFYLLDEFIGYWDYYSSLLFTDTMSGFRDRFVNSGQNLAKFASLPLLLVQSFTLPYPSMVQTNIRFYGVAAQWYHIGGMFIYTYLAYWGILGIFDTIVKKNTKALPLVLFLLMYTFVLIFSMYITAIRMNLIKISIMLIFIAYGLSNRTPKRNYGWVIYLVFISIIIFVWNYIKLSGRGML